MLKINEHKISFWFLILAFLTILILTYKDGVPFILTWDTFGYSAYLPLGFIKHSFILHDLSFFEKVNETYHNTPSMYQFITLENGNVITKYTIGWSLVMSPFYFIADLWARWGNYPVDGFSLPYQYMMAFGSSFYTFLGLFFTRKVLLHFFNDIVATIVLFILVFGSNYFLIQFISLGSSHTLEFCFLAILLWLTIQFHQKTTLNKSIILGVIVGIIGLIRPPDLIFVLIPFFWNIRLFGGVKSKIIHYFKNERKNVIALCGSALVILSIQSIFWKITTGHFIINSYMNNAGEGFDWFTPYTIDLLFSFRKGWLLYTPIMFFGVIGLFIWRKKDPSHGNFLLIVFFIFLYVVSCWTTWWYAASFGQRSMVDIYPLLAIGFGFFILNMQSRLSRSLFMVIGVLFTFLNLFQTYQVSKGVLHVSNMTKDYYFSTFGQLSPPTSEQLDLLLIDKNQAVTEGFIHPEKYTRCYSKRISFPSTFELNDSTIYTPTLDFLPSDISKKDHFWLRATWKYEGDYSQLEGKIFNAAALYHNRAYGWNGRGIGDPLLKVDTLKKEVIYEYLSPDIRSKHDPIRVGIWKQGGQPLKIRTVLVEGFHRIQNPVER